MRPTCVVLNVLDEHVRDLDSSQAPYSPALQDHCIVFQVTRRECFMDGSVVCLLKVLGKFFRQDNASSYSWARLED